MTPAPEACRPHCLIPVSVLSETNSVSLALGTPPGCRSLLKLSSSLNGVVGEGVARAPGVSGSLVNSKLASLRGTSTPKFQKPRGRFGGGVCQTALFLPTSIPAF